MKTLVLNAYGGPGTGKSTTCAGVFHELKLAGVNCELALEWAKEKVWAGEEITLSNQLYAFGKQYHRIWRLLGKVDLIITDAPLLNSILYYKGENQHFGPLVAFEHFQLQNFNVLLERVKPFNPAGRLQDEMAAKALDVRITQILDFLGESYFRIPAIRSSIDVITDMALQKLWRLNGT